jgi:hypothetical protein
MGELLELLMQVLTALGIAAEIKAKILELFERELRQQYEQEPEDCHPLDIDSMQDLDDGRPYIWNR